jgi:hypothetical protein
MRLVLEIILALYLVYSIGKAYNDGVVVGLQTCQDIYANHGSMNND